MQIMDKNALQRSKTAISWDKKFFISMKAKEKVPFCYNCFHKYNGQPICCSFCRLPNCYSKIPNLVYVDDKTLLTMLATVMQRLLQKVGAWSTWTKIKFITVKCWYFHKTYQGRWVIHLEVDLTLKGLQCEKADSDKKSVAPP